MNGFTGTGTEEKAQVLPVTDTEQARLYGNIKNLDTAIKVLQQSSVFNKAAAAENVVLIVMDTLSKLTLANHALMNEITRLKKFNIDKFGA